MLIFIRRPIAVFVSLAIILAALSLRPLEAAGRKLSFIRDAEIENTIRDYAAPLFRAAGLQSSSIKIFLVNDNSLNAFVAGGQKLFLNTGLVLKSAHPGQLIGVIAHETGHISGGHLARARDAMSNATAQTILALVLGGAAAVACRPDVGAAIALGGQQAGLGSFLKYTRTQESAADQAAMSFLDATGQSAVGLREFMELLEDQELLSTTRQDPYLRTHPLSGDRIVALDAHIARSPYSRTPQSQDFIVRHRRMLAKLTGFLKPLATTLRTYKETDNSLESRYARAIAYYRKPQMEKALALIDSLIAENPADPYFHELRGQMLFENGRPAEALISYKTAVGILPHSFLLRADLAKVQLELNDPALLDDAIANLQVALQFENQVPFTWRQLAIAYGRKGKMGESSLALAEEALLVGKKEPAIYHATRAETLLPRGSIGWLKAQDILETAKRQ